MKLCRNFLGNDAVQEKRRIIVFEKQRYWSAELERVFQGRNVHIRFCVSGRDVQHELQKSAADVVVLTLVAAEAECLQCLTAICGQHDNLPVIVVSSAQNADLEMFLREMGATSVLAYGEHPEELARRCERCWTPRRSRSEIE